MRKTKEFYNEKYNEFLELREQGLSMSEIAKRLQISYSAVYAWIRGRKPEESKVTKFIKFLRNNGPTPLAEIRKLFPKHSDIYLTAVQRGYKILKYTLPKKFGDYSIWYLLPEQEADLKREVEKFIKEFNRVKEKLSNEMLRRVEEREYKRK